MTVRAARRRLLAAVKLVLLAATVGLAVAGAVVATAGAGALWLQAQAGDAGGIQLERYMGWAPGLDVTVAVVAGSVVGLAWSRASGDRQEGQRW
jgi:hypothetical protein